MPLEKQISIFVKNKVGSLSELCTALAKDGVNVRAMYTVDDIDWGVVGMIPDNLEQTKETLKKLGYRFGENTVLTVERDNEPGMLAKIATLLTENNINIVQTFATAAGSRSLIVLLTTDDKKAEKVLT